MWDNRAECRKWYRQNAHLVSAQGAIKTRDIKLGILKHYSQGRMACARCGYNNPDALFLDHIDHNGGEQRKQLFGSVNGGGTRFYIWLFKEGLPPGFQVLCANCNWLKEIERRRDARRERWKLKNIELNLQETSS